MAGELHYLAGGPASWRAGQLSSTPISSCEAEYIGASRTAVTSCHLRDVITFYKGKPITAPTVIFCDNLSAVMLSDSNTSSKRMKHVTTRIAFLRELVANKTILLYHIGTNGQLADIFTKPLAAQTFHELRSIIMS